MNCLSLSEKLHCPVTSFDEIPSTNDYLKETARTDTKKCMLAIADRQTRGKGRLGKTFYSPAGAGIYMSYLFYPELEAKDGYLLTVSAAVAVVKALKTLYGVSAAIKWVNDIYVGGKKLCGILSESAVPNTGRLAYAVVGIGINIQKTAYPPEIRDIAVSLEEILGESEIDRESLIAKIWQGFSFLLNTCSSQQIVKLYRESSFLIGKTVSVLHNNTSFDAVVTDIDDAAQLIVSDANGCVHALSSGEISIKIK